MKNRLYLKITALITLLAVPQILTAKKAEDAGLTEVQKQHVKYLRKVITLPRLKGREVELAKKYPKGVPVSVFLWTMEKDGTAIDLLTARVFRPLFTLLIRTITVIITVGVVLCIWPLGLKLYRHFYPYIPSFKATVELGNKKAYRYEKVPITIDFEGEKAYKRYRLKIENDPASGTIIGAKEWVSGKEKVRLTFTPKKKNAQLPKITITDQKEANRFMKDGVSVRLGQYGNLTYIEPAKPTQELIAEHAVIIKELDWQINVKQSDDRDKATIEIEPSDQEQREQDMERLEKEGFEVRNTHLTNLEPDRNIPLDVSPYRGGKIQISGLTKLRPRAGARTIPSVDLRIKNMTTNVQKMISIQVAQIDWGLKQIETGDRDKAMMEIETTGANVSDRDKAYLIADGWEWEKELTNLRENTDYPLSVAYRGGKIQISGLTKLQPVQLRQPSSVKLMITNKKTGIKKPITIPVQQLDWKVSSIPTGDSDKATIAIEPADNNISKKDIAYLLADGWEWSPQLTNLSDDQKKLKIERKGAQIQINGLTKLKLLRPKKPHTLQLKVRNKKTGIEKPITIPVQQLDWKVVNRSKTDSDKATIAIEPADNNISDQDRKYLLADGWEWQKKFINLTDDKDNPLNLTLTGTKIEIVGLRKLRPQQVGRPSSVDLRITNKKTGSQQQIRIPVQQLDWKVIRTKQESLDTLKMEVKPKKADVRARDLKYLHADGYLLSGIELTNLREHRNGRLKITSQNGKLTISGLTKLRPIDDRNGAGLRFFVTNKKTQVNKPYSVDVSYLCNHHYDAEAFDFLSDKGFEQFKESSEQEKLKDKGKKKLFYAAEKGHLEVVEYLTPKTTPKEHRIALINASTIPNNLPVIKHLLKRVVSEHAKNAALIVASRIPNNLINIEYLFPHADQDAKKEALWAASKIPNNLTNIEYLFPHADQDIRTYALINASTIPNNLTNIEYLFPHADQYGKNKTLMNASRIPNNLTVINHLLKRIVNQDAKNAALMNASTIPNNLTNIEYLFPHATDWAKNIALEEASRIPNNLTNIEYLLPHARQKSKNLALEEASQVPNNLTNIEYLFPHASYLCRWKKFPRIKF